MFGRLHKEKVLREGLCESSVIYIVWGVEFRVYFVNDQSLARLFGTVSLDKLQASSRISLDRSNVPCFDDEAL